ncbi:hypothetical protein, partial [Klebsiella pneumoniae]|uniref:hypothetical protein n=1 Tax=Klebsiella pneumoniae TaxID=573 RepID=UPI00003DD2DA
DTRQLMAAALVVVIGQNSIPESFGRLTGYLTRLARVLCFMGLANRPAAAVIRERRQALAG